MRILFVSNYFPPEVNAPATRLYEHAVEWVNDGHEVEVLTAPPHFPEGKVYDGYRNRIQHEEVDGIEVTRVPMYVTANEGTLKRTLSYVSFMLSAVLLLGSIRKRPDVVVATSPQFFCGLGGYFISRLLRRPFVLEIRDLWPESIVAVGAMERNAVIRMLEIIEKFLYHKADHIVVVTNAFRRFIADKGIHEDKITVLKNGADLSSFAEPLDESMLDAFRAEHDINGQFVVSYIGTLGMAHRAGVMLEAAQRCPNPDILFVVMGTGAERDTIAARAKELDLPNFRLIDKQPRKVARHLLGLSDVSLVHLKDSPVFRTVIPSKIFEAMATWTPIILGVEGETREIIEESGCGIPIPPEDVDALVRAACTLCDDLDLYHRLAANGSQYVFEHHYRKTLARRYAKLLEDVAGMSGRVIPDRAVSESATADPEIQESTTVA